MKYLIPLALLLGVLLSGCTIGTDATGADATATISPEDIRATADVMVYDMLTKTQAAMPPTDTVAPPTIAPPTLPAPTLSIPTTAATLAIGAVPPLLSTPIASPTFGVAAINTTAPPANVVSCMDSQLNEWSGGSFDLSVTNNVGETTANVFLCITTETDEIGFINIHVGEGGSGSKTVPQGCYSATAWVDGKRDFNDTVFFCANSGSTMQLVIENNRLFIRGGCAPDC